MDYDPQHEASFQAWRAQLTEERLRHLFKLENAWLLFGARLDENIIDAAMGQNIRPGDTRDHMIIQNVLLRLGDFCHAVGGSPTVTSALLRVLQAFDARCAGVEDLLFAITKRNPKRSRPIEIVFFALVVAAVIEQRAVGTSRETKLGYALTKVLWQVGAIADDQSLRLLVKKPPTRIAVQRWYEKRQTVPEFGSLVRAILARVPPELTLAEERTAWLLRNIAEPCDPVDPQLRSSLGSRAASSALPSGAGRPS